MNYKQLVEAYLRLDFKLELFKTVMPTMVAVSLIYINNPVSYTHLTLPTTPYV